MLHTSKVSINSFHFLQHNTVITYSRKQRSTLCDPIHSGMVFCEEFIEELLLAMVVGTDILPTEVSAKLWYKTVQYVNHMSVYVS